MVSSPPSVGSIKVIVTLFFVIHLRGSQAFGILCNYFHGHHVTLLFNRWAPSPDLNCFSFPSLFSDSCCALWVLPLHEFVESRDLRLTAWPVSGFWLIPPWPTYRDSLKSCLLLLQLCPHHRVLRVLFSCFALWWQFQLCFLVLAWPLRKLLLAAASSGMCMRLYHLCHREYEGLALCLAVGGATVSQWIHNFHFQVRNWF